MVSEGPCLGPGVWAPGRLQQHWGLVVPGQRRSALASSFSNSCLWAAFTSNRKLKRSFNNNLIQTKPFLSETKNIISTKLPQELPDRLDKPWVTIFLHWLVSLPPLQAISSWADRRLKGGSTCALLSNACASLPWVTQSLAFSWAHSYSQ